MVGHALDTSTNANVNASRRYGVGNDRNCLKAAAALPVDGSQSAFLRDTGMQLSHSAYCSAPFGWEHIPHIDIFDQFGIDPTGVEYAL
jgi:hypothetical protein